MGKACIASMQGSSIMHDTRDSCRDYAEPYRAQTKGKVERFIGYLKRSFWVPFVASMRQAGLKPDKHAANAAVARWLREVANARVHATTNEVPAERLAIEQAASCRHSPCPTKAVRARSLVAPVRRTSRRLSASARGLRRPDAGRCGMNNLYSVERITVLAQELRLTALPYLYGGIAQSAANKKDASYAEFLENVLEAAARCTTCPVPRDTDADGGLPGIKDAGGLRLRVRHRRAAQPNPGAGVTRLH